MSSRKGEKMDLFGGGGDLQSLSDEIYGSSEVPDGGRVVARPTAINTIWADRKQPRRAIPSTIGMHWDGDPDKVPALLGQWHAVAETQSGVQLNIVKLLNGEGEGLDSDKFPSVAQEYISLVRLAAHIHANKLMHPITVVESDGRLLIEAGERRWLAYHLLNTYLGDEWAKIPATKADGKESVWRQAGENTQRRALNAIGMARQMALLIMAARSGNTSVIYREYEDMVTGGVSDRRYYAQVADGNVHRIPSGMAEKIQAAMGLSETMLARYRSLLELTDDSQINDVLWTRADIENWPEYTIREVATLPTGKVREVLERGSWTLDDLKALKEASKEMPKAFEYPQRSAAAQPLPRRPVTSEWMHKTVITKGNLFCKVIGVDGDWIVVTQPDGNRRKIHFGELTFAGDRPGAAPASPAPQPAPQTFLIGDTVRTRSGSEGVVTSVSGRLVGVKTANGYTNHDYSLLVKIEKAAPQPVVESTHEDVFKVDDAVTVIATEEVGKIYRQRSDGAYFVTLLGQYHDHSQYYEASELSALGMTWDEYAKKAQMPLIREWSEGISIGGSNEDASDKASSVGQTVEQKPLFNFTSNEHKLLDALMTFIANTGDEDSYMLIGEIMHMTDVRATTLHDSQLLKPKLDDVHDVVIACYAGIWQKVMDAAQ